MRLYSAEAQVVAAGAGSLESALAAAVVPAAAYWGYSLVLSPVVDRLPPRAGMGIEATGKLLVAAEVAAVAEVQSRSQRLLRIGKV